MQHPLRVLVSISAIALLTALSACSSDSGTTTDSTGSAASPTGEPTGVAVFLSIAANSYEQAQADGVKAAAETLGAGEVQIFDGGFDSSKQIGQVQDAVTSGRFKVFVIEPVDGAAIVAPLQRAAAEGIQVVCITSACGPDSTNIDLQFPEQAGVVASDYAVVADRLSARAIAACEGVAACQVFFLNGDSTFPSDRTALDAVETAMAAAPDNIDYVGSQDGKYDRATGRAIMQAELQRNPGLMVVISLADQQTLGAAQGVDAAGKADQVTFISFGGSEQGVKAVADGSWLATLATMPYSIGETGATIGIQLANGETPESQVVDSNTLAPGDGFVTQENAATFEPQWAG